MLRGIFTPIVTPFQKNEEIDYNKLKYNLERLGKSQLAGVVVLGSNGEFAYMSGEEKLELVDFVVSHIQKDKKVIVGTGCETTRDTIRLNKAVAERKVDAVLMLPPHYYKASMKDGVLKQHYFDVADQSPLPVMLYNMPANTGLNLHSSLVAEIACHENIVGIKDSSGNIVQIAETVRDTGNDFSVFAGSAGFLLPALSVGAVGATVALGNILPDECCRLYSLFYEGKMDEARSLQLRLLEINSAVTTGLGIPALKAAMDILGYRGGESRRPLRPLSQENKKLLIEILKRCGAL